MSKKIKHTTKKSSMVFNNYFKTIWCVEGQLFIENKCILFKQYKNETYMFNINYHKKNEREFTKIYFYQNENVPITEYFSLIQQYADQPLQFILPIPLNESFITYTAFQSSIYEKLHWIGKISNKTLSQHDGYLLFPVPFSQMKVETALFHCTDGSHIDETLICNGIEDCKEGSDEENCICKDSSQLSPFFSVCKYKCYSTPQKCTCSDFFYQCSSFPFCIPYSLVCDGQKDCQQGEDEFCNKRIRKIKKGSECTSRKITFKCMMSGNSIPVSFVDNLVPECPTSFEDEAQYYNLLTAPYHSGIPCNNSNELPCVPGHNRCFPMSKLCVYDFHHKSLQIKHCRNGAHLHNCTNFQCVGYFKCSLSYCIPFDYVCNGKWDCPDGCDEHNCFSHSCSHLFKCKNQIKCLHFSKVCDKNKDCIHGDDELLCTSCYSLSCPLKCVCFAQSIVCHHLNYIKHQKIWGFMKYFKCYSCTLKFSNIHFSSLLNITFLDIKDEFSKHICISKEVNNPTFSSLREIDMSFNKITIVKSSCLKSLENLKMLYLQVNRIECVEDKSFNALSNLKILDLSYNKITKLTKEVFVGLKNVVVIKLTLNLITSVSSNTFSSISQNVVHSLNKQVCCMSGLWLKCKVKTDGFSNCNNLLFNRGLTQVCWVTGIAIVLMNSISIIIHISLFSQLQTNKFFTLGLSLVDCLYGLYILIITFAYVYYRGYYAGVEPLWKQSLTCKASSIITLISFITSPIILFIMVLARFCVIQWPMTSKFKCEVFSRRITLAVLLTIVTCLFTVFITFVYGFGYQVPNGVCLLLYLTGQKSKIIWLTSLLIICVQMFCLISNATLTMLTIQALFKMKHSNTSQSLKGRKNKQIIIHLLSAMVTNICCWIPSSVVFFLPLAGYQVSSYILLYIIIMVIPMHFIINPILFSILTPTLLRWFLNKWTSLINHQI